MAEAVIRTRGLSKRFGSLLAVDDLNLEVDRGEIFGFLGPNGAGKTTTIGMLLGLVHPSAGRVEIMGSEVSPGRRQALRAVGALVGRPGFVPYLSGRENLRLVARLYPDVDDRQVDYALDRLGLGQAAKRAFSGYSTGMQQRLGLAAAILHRPSLIVLDEPTNGLDPSGVRQVRGLMLALAAEGTTVFLSSHLLHEVQQVCDRVAVLHHGKLIAGGPVAGLLGAGAGVQVRVASPVDAARRLQTLEGVCRAREEDGYVVVEGASAEKVIEHLAAGGIFPSEVTTAGRTLEEMFVELTQDEREVMRPC